MNRRVSNSRISKKKRLKSKCNQGEQLSKVSKARVKEATQVVKQNLTNQNLILPIDSLWEASSTPRILTWEVEVTYSDL